MERVCLKEKAVASEGEVTSYLAIEERPPSVPELNSSSGIFKRKLPSESRLTLSSVLIALSFLGLGSHFYLLR